MIKNNVVNKDRNCGRLNDFHMPTNNLFADKINDSIAFSFDPFSLQHYDNSNLVHRHSVGLISVPAGNFVAYPQGVVQPPLQSTY